MDWSPHMNTEDDNYVRGWPLLLAATLEYETEIENRDRPKEGGEYGTMEVPPKTVYPACPLT